ncbi:MAG: LysR family transcriptional regulator [Pseudomonadota bacterium]
MDTDSVRLFVLAADKLNISAAGRELGMAPAVASARLAKLEKSLGADLLHRSTRKVALSLEGAEFLPYAREILAQEGAARAALGLGSSVVTGTLRFAAPSSFSQLYIAPLLPDFLNLHPGINLDLRFSDAQFDLIEGSFDLALRNASLADSSLKARKLADDRRILCASPGYFEKHGTPRHPDELSGHQLIAFRDQGPKRLIGAKGEHGLFDPRSAACRVVVDDGLSQKISTVAGAGISINSLWSVHRELSSGALVQILPDHEIDDPVALWLVYPKSNVLTAKVRALIDFLLERIGRSPPWGADQPGWR